METNDERDVDRMIAERFSALHPDGEWQPDLGRGLALLRARRGGNTGRRKSWGWVMAGAVATCLPIMAFPITRAFATHCVSACVQETATVTQLLLGNIPISAGPSSTYVRPADRKPAPDFTLRDASGKPVKLSGLRGKVVLLNFWATWCAPCKQEIPWFIEFQRANEGRGFEVVGVSMDEDGWTSVRPYIEEKRINYPVAIGDEEVAALFGGLRSIPLTLILDRSGRIAAIHEGLCGKDEYEGDIKSVLNEKQEAGTKNERSGI